MYSSQQSSCASIALSELLPAVVAVKLHLRQRQPSCTS